MNILNSLQLRKILEGQESCRKIFKGVYSIDTLEKIDSAPCCFIVNTHKSNQPGEHWLAIYVDHEKNLEFFDSYGNSPERFDLLDYCFSISNKVSWNTQQVQSYSSTYCGYYAVLYLIYKCNNFSLKDFLRNFSNNPFTNDRFLNKLINQYV